MRRACERLRGGHRPGRLLPPGARRLRAAARLGPRRGRAQGVPRRPPGAGAGRQGADRPGGDDRRSDVPAAPDRVAPGAGGRPRAGLRRDRRQRDRPGGREHRVPERPRPRAAPGDGGHPGRRPRRPRAPPRRATADRGRGSGARPRAVVARAHLPRPPADRHHARPLHGRIGRSDPLRTGDDLDVRPRDPASPHRGAGALEDDPPRRIDGPVLRDTARHPGRRAIDPVGNGRGRVTRERFGLFGARRGQADALSPTA